MRSRTTDWFEVKIRYEKMQDDGQQKKTTEQYVVDALTFTEAETSIIEEMRHYIAGDFKISDIKPASYSEIFFSDKTTDDRWFKAKLQYITLDEKTAKEKRTSVNYLCQAHSLPQAVEYMQEVMGKTMSDYVIAAINETQIMDVFEHDGTRQHLTNLHDGNADDDIVEYERQEAQTNEQNPE